jgi:hypothetical protein
VDEGEDMTPDVNAGRPSYLGDGGGEDEPYGVDEGEDMTPDVNAGRPSYLGDGGGEDEPHGVYEGEDEAADENGNLQIFFHARVVRRLKQA